MNETSAIHPDEAADALDSIRSTRAATHERLASQWPALVVFGALLVLSSPLYDVGNGAAAALFWLASAPIGIYAVTRHRRAQMRATGAALSGREYAPMFVALGAGFFVLSVVGAATGEGEIAVYGPPFAVSAAYLGFAAVHRFVALAPWALGVAGISILFVLIGSETGAQVFAFTIGGNHVLRGLAERSGRSSP